jgi:hypothetical protein
MAPFGGEKMENTAWQFPVKGVETHRNTGSFKSECRRINPKTKFA